MAVPAYTTDLTTMDAAQSSTGWAEATASGWTSVFAVTGGETDDFIQNNACNSTTVKTGVGTLLYNNGSGITLNTDDAVLVWMKWDVSPSLATEANGGIRTVQGSSLSDFYAFTHLGSDSYIYGGWRNLATGDRADSEITEDYTAGSPSTTKQYHGWAFNALSVPSKGNPYKVDAIRYGRCELRINGGETADYATFAGAAAVNDLNVTTFNRWGLFQAVPGGFLWKGLITLGYTSAVDFRDSATNISIDDTKHVTKNFNKIEVRQATSRVDWTGVSFSALGTKSPGRFEMIDAADVNLLNCSFSDMDTFVFLSSGSALSCSWNRCAAVTANGADLSGSSILAPNISANTSGLIWNVNTDPSGLLDDMTFSKTSGTAHHAIEFGTAIADGASFTLNNCAFGTDFSATAGGTTGDETFHFLDTTGSITLNLVGCTGNKGYRTAGVSVTIVDDPVTTAITVTNDSETPLISGARVFLETSDGTGPLPYQEAVTITQTGGTATVAHTAHGIPDGTNVVIRGAAENGYNKVATITSTGANSYTYAVDSGTASPATGSPVASGVIIHNTTNGAGIVSDVRVLVPVASPLRERYVHPLDRPTINQPL